MFKKHYLITLLLLLSIINTGYSIDKNPIKKKTIDLSSKRIYTSSLKEGFIGTFENLPIDNPTDNIFTVNIDKIPDADEQVFLTYELYGISNHTGISRSINDQLSIGGYFVTQNNDWQLQNEQLKTSWIKEGKNQIRFTLPKGVQYHYRVRNLEIVIKKSAIKVRSIILNQPAISEYTNAFGYTNGFIEGKGADSAKLYLDGVKIQTLSSEFEILAPRKGSSPRWKTTLKAVFADGETIEKQIEFSQLAKVSYKNEIGVRSAAYAAEQYTPEKSLQLAIKGASITLEPQALLQSNTISITALRNVDIPALDGAMVNVTKNYDGFRFLPHGTQFTKNAKVTLEYDADKIPEGYTEKDIKTFYFDENTKHWVALERDSIQNKEHVIVSNTTHFTDMINGIIKVPESPETSGFVPTSISDIKVADPFMGINTIEKPTANNMGSASLSYPIDIPAGRLGMQPSLEIQYDSNSGNNWLGLGWNIHISSINIDTRWGVPRYDDSLETETYLLSGEELTPVAHRKELISRSNNKQFYPRVEGNFNKIIRHGNNPKNYWWEVTDKSGTTYSYGGSNQDGIINTAVLKDQDGNIAQWSLVETRDLNNNFVKYHYAMVQDLGITGGKVQGFNNYIDKITYTGNGFNEGKYEVLFTRDRELGETKRKDVLINARYGFKQVIADLLRKIEVKYNGATIRSYDLHYKEGAFFKNLLDKITEFDSKGQEFNHHDMEYFDDVKALEGYKPYTDEVSVNSKNDNVKGNFPLTIGEFNDNASAIDGSKSFGGGFGIYVGIGPLDGNLAAKSSTVGADFGYNRTNGEGMLSLIDINGDNLPDKVFVKDGLMKFRPNLSGTGGNTTFGEEMEVRGINSFSESNSDTFSIGLSANFPVFIGFQSVITNTAVKTYFCEVNGDRLIDIVKNGEVYYNHLENGFPVFTKSSADTPSPIVGISFPPDASSVVVDPAELEKLIDRFPLHDLVRVWEAPYTGTVSIDAPVSLDPSEKSIDGVRVAIQHGARELWNTTIKSGDFSIKNPNLQTLSITKGDKIYFRLQSVFNGEADVVLWNPTITYSNHTTNIVDADNLPIYQFKASDGFIMSAEQNIGMPINGTITINGQYEKPETTDSVTFQILGTNERGEGITIWEKTYLPEEKATQNLNVSIPVVKDQNISFKVKSDSNIDWKALKWIPKIYYTNSSDSKISQVTNTDGSPMIQFYPVVNYSLYTKSLYPTTIWKATKDSIATVIPQITFNNASYNGNITLTIKKKNTLINKQILNIANGQITNNTQLRFPCLAEENYFFEISTTDIKLAEGVQNPLLKIITAPRDTISIQAGLVTQKDSNIFGPMYRHWGQFGYNGNRNKAVSPINEAELTPLTDTAKQSGGNIDLSSATTVEEMNRSYDDQGGQQVNQTNFILLLPDNIKKRWNGNDNLHWLSETKMSSSRLGMDNLVIESPISGSNNTTSVRGFNKISNSISIGLSAGVSGGVASVGGSFATAFDKVTSEFTDFNGDGYPDFLSNDQIQYTKANGTLEKNAKTINSSLFQESTSYTVGLALNGQAPTSSSKVSNQVVAKKSEVGKVRSGKSSANSQKGGEKASASVGISGSLSKTLEESSHSFIDVNGDGLPDKVYKGGDVALNLGYKFAPIENWGFSSIRNGDGEDFGAGLGISLFDGSIEGGVGLSLSLGHAKTAVQDVNGDGLPDFFNKDDKSLFINTGNGFIKTPWSGIDDIQETISTGASANVAFTVCIPIVIIGIKICINPSVNISSGANKETVSIMDIDGDGYPDILKSKKDNSLTVKYSSIGRTNMLKGVKRPLGANFTLDYVKKGNTYEQPETRWVLQSVDLNDGYPSDGIDHLITKFEYENGYQDRHEREFYGFEKVIEKQIDAADNSVYMTLIQEFYNRDYYRKNLLKHTYALDQNNKIRTENINEYKITEVATQASLPVSKLNLIDFDAKSIFVSPASILSKTFESNGDVIEHKVIMTFDARGNQIQNEDFGNGTENSKDTTKISYYESTTPYYSGIPKQLEVFTSEGLRRKRATSINQKTTDVTQIKNYLAQDKIAVTDITYDDYGNFQKITNPANYKNQRMTIDYVYDPENHQYITEIKDAFGYQNKMEYDYRFGELLKTTDRNNQSTSYTIDAKGRRATITAPYEIASGKPYTIAYEYFPDAKVPYAKTKNYDPELDKDIETFAYTDGLRRSLQVKKTANLFTSAGNPDVEGQIITGKMIYDGLGRTIAEYYPTFASTTDNNYSTTVALEAPKKTEYDEISRIKKVVFPDGSTLSTGYAVDNVNGIPTMSMTQTDALGKTTQIQTDVMDRNILTKENDLVTKFEVNALGETLKVTDVMGHETKSTYDWLGRRTSFTSPDAGTTNMEYDLSGNLLKLITQNIRNTVPNGGSVEYGYDFNRRETIKYPINPQNNVRYSYGKADGTPERRGRLWLVQDASGGQEYFYGKMGEIIKEIRTLRITPTDIQTYISNFEYDSWGRIQKMTYPDGEVLDYGYNRAGNLVTMQGKKENFTYDYIKQLSYDKFEQRTYLKYGNNTETSYSYDPAMRRLQNQKVNSGARIIMDNSYNYDLVGNILGIKNSAPIVNHTLGGTSEQTYTYDDFYRLKTAKGAYQGEAAKATYELNMQYNNIYNIVKKDLAHKVNNVQKGYVLDYNYDNELHPNAPNEIQKTSKNEPRKYMYDGNGNSTGYTEYQDFRKMIWDEENRLMGINDGGRVHQYTYDATGERVIKSSSDSKNVSINGQTAAVMIHTDDYTGYVSPYFVIQKGKFTKHYFEGAGRIVSKLGNGTFAQPLKLTAGGIDFTARTVEEQKALDNSVKILGVPPGPPTQQGIYASPEYTGNPYPSNVPASVDENQEPPAGWPRNPKFNTKGDVPGSPVQFGPLIEPATVKAGEGFTGIGLPENNIFYFHLDHLGSSSYITDANGEVTQHLEYLPFGETFLEEHTNTSYSPYLYNGKELDDETGLYYYGARYYDTETSIWQSTDPLAEKYSNMSPYNYCANNPVKYVDPDGRTIEFAFTNYTAEQLKLFRRPPPDPKLLKEQTLQHIQEIISSGPQGKRLIDSLENSEQIIYIKPLASTSPIDAQYLPDSKTVLYHVGQPQKMFSAEYEDGTQDTNGVPYITLAHELGHALDDINGTLDNGTWHGGVLNAEIFACHIENKIRAENGLPLRTNYTTNPKTMLLKDGKSIHFNNYDYKAANGAGHSHLDRQD